MLERSSENNARPSEKMPKTRRQILAGQCKAIVAVGATVLSTTMAKAAPRPPCFLSGTNIRTATGERPVDTIAAGDQVVTASGQCREVVWTGNWQVRRAAGEAWSKSVRPVRIKQSALAPNVPYQDLLVSQGHAIFIDGVLIPACELVNGRTIVFDDADDSTLLEYFHVKLASHDVIFAAGAPTETLLLHPDAVSDLDPAHRGPREAHCAPFVCRTVPGIVWSRARRAATPLLGPQKLDVIRERLASQSA